MTQSECNIQNDGFDYQNYSSQICSIHFLLFLAQALFLNMIFEHDQYNVDLLFVTFMIFYSHIHNVQRASLLWGPMAGFLLHHVLSTQCRKLIEAVLAGCLIIAIFIQVLLDIKMRGRCHCGFTQVIQVLMVSTLICNLAFSINHDLPWFYYSESFFYDCYFCTLVFYMTYRMVEKSTDSTRAKLLTLKISFVLIILGFFIVFLYSGFNSVIDCKQIWFLVVDIVGIVICSVMILIGYRHHQRQRQKFLDFRNVDQINNPLARIWTIILINLFCQVVQLIQSLVFLIQSPDLKCHFSENQNVDVIVKLIFSIFSLHLSFVCTIMMFRIRRVNEQNYSKSTSNATVVQVENQQIQMGTIWKNQVTQDNN